MSREITFEERFNDLIVKQVEFQNMCGINFNDLTDQKRRYLAEMFLFKAIEEVVEARKTFPSGLNPFEKARVKINVDETKKELCDILFFLMNFMLTWEISIEEIFDTAPDVQQNNFNKVKRKILDQLYEEILTFTGVGKVGVGNGGINPRVVFVGQNAAQTISHGEKVFDIKYRGDNAAGNVIYEILDKIHIDLDEVFFTNAVKSTTTNNMMPNKQLQEIWYPVLEKELKILKYNNPNMLIVPMGRLAKDMTGLPGIKHPGVIFRGTPREQYIQEVLNFFQKMEVI